MSPRPRTRHLAAVCSAAGAAAVIATGPILAGHGRGSDQTLLAAAEVDGQSAAHAHARDRLTLREDRVRLARCARSAYRRAHAAFCPSTRPRPTVRSASVESPVTTGRWSAPFTVPTWAIHAVVLPTGKVLWLSKEPATGAGGEAFLYDPTTGSVRAVPPPRVRYPDGTMRPADLFCSGHSMLTDGRVVVAGGNLAYYTSNAPGMSWKGARWVFTFNPWSETWTRQPDMARGRWYPTVTTLPDGRAIIVGGWDESGNDVSNDDVEVFHPSPDVNGVDGVVTRVGTRPYAQLYPHLFVLPDTTAAGAGGGKVLMAGPMGRYPANAAILDTTTWKWTTLPPLPTNREFGAAVLLPGGPDGARRILVTGGVDGPSGGLPTSTTAVVDLDDPKAGFREGPPMVTPRTHANTVILPDGSLMAVGGGSGSSTSPGGIYAGPVYRSELLAPDASAFRAADTQQAARTYHATAVLLPDGRVLSAGDDRPAHHDASARTAELYSPPYLLTGTRPVITFAPPAAGYDVRFRVGAADPKAVASAVLVRPSAVTHVTNMDQRSIQLRTTVEDGGVTLQTPRNATLAPPGYYMLFLRDRDGTPSVARWVRLDPDAPGTPDLPADVVVTEGPPRDEVPTGNPSPPPGNPSVTAPDMEPRADEPTFPVPAAPPAGVDVAPTVAAPGPRDTRNPVVTLRARRVTRQGSVVTVRVVFRVSEPATARVRVAVGRRMATRTLRAPSGRWTLVTLRVARAPLRGRVLTDILATDQVGNVGRATRTGAR